MSQQIIIISNAINNGTGDDLRVAFGKVNNDFQQLFYANITLTGSVIGNANYNNSNNVVIATTLANSGVVAGTYNTLVVNSQGVVTYASNASYVTTSEVGRPNGVASLDSNGYVPLSEINPSVLGAMSYQGTWNANTNTPFLQNSVGTVGEYYIVSVAGNTNLNNTTNWTVGNEVIFNGSIWEQITVPPSDVTSVNGMQGAVVLTVNNIPNAASVISPVFTGNPTAPTPSIGDNSNSIATTAYVQEQNYVHAPIVATGDANGISVGNTIALTLANVATAGTFSAVVINSKGLVTTGLNMNFIGDILGNSIGNTATLTLPNINTNIGTWNTVVVNAKGQVISASNTAYLTAIDITGDATGNSIGNSLTLTLNNVNSNIGQFGGATVVPALTVNAKGLVTSVSNVAINVVGALGFTPVNVANVGLANGVASLNSSGVVPTSELPSNVMYSPLVASGDVTGNSVGNTITLTLDTVNANTGTFGDGNLTFQ